MEASPALKTAPSSASTRKRAHKKGRREKNSHRPFYSHYLQLLFSETNPS